MEMIMSDEKEYAPDDLLRVSEVAELIDRSGARVRQLIQEFDIPHQRFGTTIAVRYGDLTPIFERNTIPGYRGEDDE